MYQAMYQDWRDEYLRLKKAHPDKSDTWIAKQISKLPISQAKSEGRIRKMMKNDKRFCQTGKYARFVEKVKAMQELQRRYPVCERCGAN